jgi:intracellular sulfur oxidation DsrE/DsrF family protein
MERAEVGLKLENIGRFLRERVRCTVQILPAGDGYDFVLEKPPIVDKVVMHVTPDNVNAVVMMFWNAWHLARHYEREQWTGRLQRLIGEEEEDYAEEDD